MKKLLGKGDLKIILDNPASKGAYIPPVETREILKIVKDATYVLYTIYRTFPFKESSELEDAAIASHLSWTSRKVRDHRLILEKLNLFRTVRYGSKTDGITKMFVGRDVIALFDAGLPAEVLNPASLRKLKRHFGISSPQELVSNTSKLLTEFEQNPEKYL